MGSHVPEIYKLFSSDLIEVRNKTRNLRQVHIASKYDMKMMINPAPTQGNILMRVYNALVRGLNRYCQLPRIIFLILDDDFTKITSNYDNAEQLFSWLVGQIFLMMFNRKGETYSFASRDLEPKLLVVKPLPRSEPQDTMGNNPFRNQRRVFSRSVENVISKYEETCVANIDEIRPKNITLLDLSGNKLNTRGISKFWSGMNKAVQKLDSGRIRPFKIIFREIQEFQMQTQRQRSNNWR